MWGKGEQNKLHVALILLSKSHPNSHQLHRCINSENKLSQVNQSPRLKLQNLVAPEPRSNHPHQMNVFPVNPCLYMNISL